MADSKLIGLELRKNVFSKIPENLPKTLKYLDLSNNKIDDGTRVPDFIFELVNLIFRAAIYTKNFVGHPYLQKIYEMP